MSYKESDGRGRYGNKGRYGNTSYGDEPMRRERAAGPRSL